MTPAFAGWLLFATTMAFCTFMCLRRSWGDDMDAWDLPSSFRWLYGSFAANVGMWACLIWVWSS